MFLQHYLTAWSVETRLSAVVSCCEMVLPFVAVYNKVTVDKRTGLLQTIYGVLRAMCSVLVNDSGKRVQMSRDPCTSKVYENVTANQNIVKGSVQSDHSDRVNGASYESRGSERTNQNDEHYGAEDMKARQKLIGVLATNELSTVKILKQRLNRDLISQWKNDTVSSKDEWVQWITRLRIGFSKCGSSPSLRAASSVGDQYPQLATDLFPAAFMSVWTELDSDVQNDLTASLLRALKTGHSELVQTVLNLAEFMDHLEKRPLPIEHDVKTRKSLADA